MNKTQVTYEGVSETIKELERISNDNLEIGKLFETTINSFKDDKILSSKVITLIMKSMISKINSLNNEMKDHCDKYREFLSVQIIKGYSDTDKDASSFWSGLSKNADKSNVGDPRTNIPSASTSNTTDGSNNQESVQETVDLHTYRQGQTFKAQSYGQNYTNDEFIQLAAIVGGEDSGSYEGALAVASTMCNRADAGNWGGSHPLEVAKVEGQFVAYQGDLYNKYMSDPSSIPDYVLQATEDALNGNRNTTADSFRGYSKEGWTQIGEGGNYYYIL